jgi:hypothetical protein
LLDPKRELGQLQYPNPSPTPELAHNQPFFAHKTLFPSPSACALLVCRSFQIWRAGARLLTAHVALVVRQWNQWASLHAPNAQRVTYTGPRFATAKALLDAYAHRLSARDPDTASARDWWLAATDAFVGSDTHWTRAGDTLWIRHGAREQTLVLSSQACARIDKRETVVWSKPRSVRISRWKSTWIKTTHTTNRSEAFIFLEGRWALVFFECFSARCVYPAARFLRPRTKINPLTWIQTSALEAVAHIPLPKPVFPTALPAGLPPLQLYLFDRLGAFEAHAAQWVHPCPRHTMRFICIFRRSSALARKSNTEFVAQLIWRCGSLRIELPDGRATEHSCPLDWNTDSDTTDADARAKAKAKADAKATRPPFPRDVTTLALGLLARLVQTQHSTRDARALPRDGIAPILWRIPFGGKKSWTSLAFACPPAPAHAPGATQLAGELGPGRWLFAQTRDGGANANANPTTLRISAGGERARDWLHLRFRIDGTYEVGGAADGHTSDGGFYAWKGLVQDDGTPVLARMRVPPRARVFANEWTASMRWRAKLRVDCVEVDQLFFLGGDAAVHECEFCAANAGRLWYKTKPGQFHSPKTLCADCASNAPEHGATLQTDWKHASADTSARSPLASRPVWYRQGLLVQEPHCSAQGAACNAPGIHVTLLPEAAIEYCDGKSANVLRSSEQQTAQLDRAWRRNELQQLARDLESHGLPPRCSALVTECLWPMQFGKAPEIRERKSHSMETEVEMVELPLQADEKAARPLPADEKAARPLPADEKAALPLPANEKAALPLHADEKALLDLVADEKKVGKSTATPRLPPITPVATPASHVRLDEKTSKAPVPTQPAPKELVAASSSSSSSSSSSPSSSSSSSTDESVAPLLPRSSFRLPAIAPPHPPPTPPSHAPPSPPVSTTAEGSSAQLSTSTVPTQNGVSTLRRRIQTKPMDELTWDSFVARLKKLL